MKKKYFFGWENFKWFFREVGKIYSYETSYFSKKRIESGIAFISGIGVMLCYLYFHRNVITNSEMLADISILFIISGYQIAKIEQEKKEIRNETKTETKTEINNQGVTQTVTEPGQPNT